MTNYDRIKSMSVEGLTKFISNITKVVAVKLGEDYVVNDKQFIQQWLLQEVDIMYKLTKVQKEVILAFAENNMNVSKTARAMNYHRNNIVYHLAKIYDDCQLNPYCFYDLVELVNMSKGGDK